MRVRRMTCVGVFGGLVHCCRYRYYRLYLPLVIASRGYSTVDVEVGSGYRASTCKIGDPSGINFQSTSPIYTPLCFSITVHYRLSTITHQAMSFRITSTLRTARLSAIRPVAIGPAARSLLHTTRSLRATQAPEDPMADPKFQNFYEKIRNHQGAVDAMMKVGEVMKSKGKFTVLLAPSPTMISYTDGRS